MSKLRCSHLAIWSFAVLSFGGACVLGQVNDPGSLYGKESTQGVYVRDSAIAVEKFALAERMERLQEWGKAADVYQEILVTYPDRVIPSQLDKDGRIYQYTSVGGTVQERLSKWPAEGLNIYRARFEPQAADLLEKSPLNDRTVLSKVLAHYFVTDTARQAGIRLVDLYLENADFSAAAWTAERLLKWHPNLDDQRPLLLFRAAIALQMSGADERARSMLAELKNRFPNATGRVGGKEVALVAALEADLQRSTPVSANTTDSWPSPFGSPDGSRLLNVSSYGGAKVFGIEIPRPRLANVANVQQRRELEAQAARDRAAGNMTGILPSVDRGELFFQDNARVYALNLESGLPLPGWSATYDGERNGRYVTTAATTPRNFQYSVTVTDDSVFAVMGQVDPYSQLNAYTPAQRDTRLVCLDRRTGKEKWVARTSTLPGDSMKQLDLAGAVVAVGQDVFVAAHSTFGLQFDDCQLLCFDAATGALKWSCYVASANPTTGNWDGDVAAFGQVVPQIAFAGGRVYVQSNLGAVAAIDAYNGTIVWLNIYPRAGNTNVNPMLGRFGGWNRPDGQTGTDKPWTTSPVIVSDGKVFTLPSDGKYAHVFDAGTGVELKQIELTQYDSARSLVGVLQDKIVLASARQVFCVRWTDYDGEREPNANLAWKSTVFGRPKYAENSVAGRAFMTRDSVIVPLLWGWHRLSLKNGISLGIYPAGNRAWNEDEGPGNLLVTQDHLVIAGAERVNVYTDMDKAMAKLDAAVAASPNDPDPLLRYAEVMFVAGRVDLAVGKLDDAIRVSGGLDKLAPGPARDRMFASAMLFAQKLSRDEKPDMATIGGLYDRAGAVASTPQQQVSYRMSRARLAEVSKDDVAQLDLLQQIIADAVWRGVPVSDGANGMQPAGMVAERLVVEIIKRSPRAYDPFEQRAASALDAAGASADPEKLLSVAQTYPNSRSAAAAMLSAADAYEVVGNHRAAVQVLRQLFLKHTEAPNRPAILEALARNYLAMPNHVDVAIARLAQGAKLPGPPKLSRQLRLPDGQVIENVTFEQALVALRRYGSEAPDKALPDLNIPASRPPTPAEREARRSQQAFVRADNLVVSEGVTAVVSALREHSRHDRLVVNTADGLSAFQPGRSQPLWSVRDIGEARGCAWNNDQLLVWAPDRVTLLNAQGQRVWSTELRSVPAVEVAVRDIADNAGGGDPAIDNAELGQAENEMQLRINGRQVALRGGQRVLLRNGIVQNIQAQNAQQLPVMANAPGGNEQIWQACVSGDRAVFATSAGRIISLDLNDGSVQWQSRPSDRAIERLLGSEDFVVAGLNDGVSGKLVVMDASTGHTLSRREFPNDGGGLINARLSPDGYLVWVTPDTLGCKDLFEPGDKPTFVVQSKRQDGNPNPLFMCAIQPEQLQIVDGHILCVSDNGQFVRVYSLDGGQPLQARSSDGRLMENELGLQTRSPNGNVVLLTCAPRTYAIGQQSVVSYNLDNPDDAWVSETKANRDWLIRDAVVTRTHLLVVEGATRGRRGGQAAQLQPVPGKGQQLRLRLFSRAMVRNVESGNEEFQFMLAEPTGIASCHAVDGGLYYLTGDRKLCFLPGAK